jgi:hypothetical protein
MKRVLIITGCVILAAAIVFTVFFNKIPGLILSKFYGINISYKSIEKDPLNGYLFENLKIMNKRLGMGFYSTKASLKLNKTTSLFKSLDIDFKFRDVHFIRSAPEEVASSYDSLNKIVSMPFEGKWTYKDVSGTVEIFSNGLTLKNFAANGNEIRLSVSGDIFYNNTVDTDITIYFSSDVLKDIPPELSSVIMRDEPKEWKSFSVKTKGNIGSPALQVSGKLFRLNVGTVTVRD